MKRDASVYLYNEEPGGGIDGPWLRLGGMREGGVRQVYREVGTQYFQ